jgi:hypothetical protein
MSVTYCYLKKTPTEHQQNTKSTQSEHKRHHSAVTSYVFLETEIRLPKFSFSQMIIREIEREEL